MQCLSVGANALTSLPSLVYLRTFEKLSVLNLDGMCTPRMRSTNLCRRQTCGRGAIVLQHAQRRRSVVVCAIVCGCVLSLG
jgi:hypothetical protein